MRLLTALLCSLPAFAQNATLPAGWFGAGGSYNSMSSPKAGAWVSLALLVNRSQGLYSYSSHDITIRKGHTPTDATRTGAAMLLKQLGPVYIVGLGTAGAATTSTATTGSFSGGGAAVCQLGTSKWDVLVELQVVTQTGKTARIGFGRSW